MAIQKKVVYLYLSVAAVRLLAWVAVAALPFPVFRQGLYQDIRI